MPASKLTYNIIKRLVNTKKNLKSIVDELNSRPVNVYKRIIMFRKKHGDDFCTLKTFNRLVQDYENYKDLCSNPTLLMSKELKKISKKSRKLESILKTIPYHNIGKIMKLMKYSTLSDMKKDLIIIRDYNLLDYDDLNKLIRHC